MTSILTWALPKKLVFTSNGPISEGYGVMWIQSPCSKVRGEQTEPEEEHWLEDLHAQHLLTIPTHLNWKWSPAAQLFAMFGWKMSTLVCSAEEGSYDKAVWWMFCVFWSCHESEYHWLVHYARDDSQAFIVGKVTFMDISCLFNDQCFIGLWGVKWLRSDCLIVTNKYLLFTNTQTPTHTHTNTFVLTVKFSLNSVGLLKFGCHCLLLRTDDLQG